MNRKAILVAIILLFSSVNIIGQEGYFQLRGRIYNNTKDALSDVKIEVFEGTKSIGTDKTSQQGVFSLRFKLNKVYLVEINKAGYVPKRISVETNVPAEKSSEFFDLFSLIILDEPGAEDFRTKNGLPVSKYYYKESAGNFVGEKLGTQTFVTNNQTSKELQRLQAEINQYKARLEEQQKLLDEARGVVSQADAIKAKAKRYADSVINLANRKSQSILNFARQDSNKIVSSALEKSTKSITKDEFEKLAVDEKQFQNKKDIQILQHRVNELVKQQNKTSRDSIDLKKDRLSLRKELFDLAQYQLEIDRLNVRTKEDSMRIEQRESQLFLMKQDMVLAEQELENANNRLMMKDLEIKNKNIMLVSFVIGSLLLLILLGYIYYNYRDKKRINKILEYQNQELEKLSIVASETSNAVIITDNKGDFTWVNQGYTRLFGYELEEVTGDNPRSLIQEENDEGVKLLISKALNKGEIVNYEFEVEAKFGNKIWVQTTITPLMDKEGRVSKMIVIDSDISKIKQAELEILTQSRLLSRQNDQIMASINYGKRIQDAILPSESLIKSYFPDSFIYFKPRDIVSGDFYWFSVQDNKLFVAAVDCTGHGVPGAFMSLIGNSLLNHIVNERKIYKPSEILKALNIGVNKALSQSKAENDEREDGMDLTMCCFDKDKHEVQIACANHTALIVNNSEYKEIEGDEISIGEAYSKVENLSFTNHKVPFERNSIMYLFSDGYQDQLGGPKNKKFMMGKFKNFLIEHQNEAIVKQISELNKAFQNWKGENKQTDDVLVMGIRLNVEA